jgi:Na+-translocating ferredoxin:NAD+ oxidoreductase RnfD subunit
MTPAPPSGAEPQQSRFGGVLIWLWRLANTALLAAAIWVLWQQTLEFRALNAQLSNLLDYLSIIAEKIR